MKKQLSAIAIVTSRLVCAAPGSSRSGCGRSSAGKRDMRTEEEEGTRAEVWRHCEEERVSCGRALLVAANAVPPAAGLASSSASPATRIMH